MTTEKRIEIAARLLGDLARVSLTPEDIKARCRDALDIVDALEEAAGDCKPQYNWANAPAWAQWAATDPSGTACWYLDEPILGDTMWVLKNGTIQDLTEEDMFTATEKICVRWRESLERRPE